MGKFDRGLKYIICISISHVFLSYFSCISYITFVFISFQVQWLEFTKRKRKYRNGRVVHKINGFADRQRMMDATLKKVYEGINNFSSGIGCGGEIRC